VIATANTSSFNHYQIGMETESVAIMVSLCKENPRLQGLPGSRSAKRVLTTFSEAVIEEQSHLAWTVANVIATEHLPSAHCWRPLGLLNPPTFATVGALSTIIGTV